MAKCIVQSIVLNMKIQVGIVNKNDVKSCVHIYIGLRFERLNSAKRAFGCTVKAVLRGHSKIDKTKVLKTNGS